jgi:hypothetical protein
MTPAEARFAEFMADIYARERRPRHTVLRAAGWIAT